MKIPQQQSKLLRKFAEIEMTIEGAVIATITPSWVVHRKLRIGTPVTISLDQSRDLVFRDGEWFFPVEHDDAETGQNENQYIAESLLQRVLKA